MRAAHTLSLVARYPPRSLLQMFIYILCQGSFKLIVGKLAGWGPSRAFADITPQFPKMD